MPRISLLLVFILLMTATVAEAQTSAQDFFNRGVKRMDANDWDGAVADYTEVIARNPSVPEVYFNRSIALHRKRDLAGAIADLTKAIELKPTFAQAYYFRGVVLDERGGNEGADRALAREDFTKVIELDPKHGDAYYLRAGILERTGEIDGALADYAKALELNPKNVDAYMRRGDAMKLIKNFDGAIAEYDKYIALKPEDPYGYSKRGEARFNKKDFDNALIDYTKTVELNPKDSRALLHRARINLMLNKGGAAYQDAAKYIEAVEADFFDTESILIGYFGLRKENKTAEVNTFLASSKKLLDESSRYDRERTSKLIRYLTGELTEKQLTDELRYVSPEAHLFIGLNLALAGDREAALNHLRSIKDDGERPVYDYFPYYLAEAEIKRIEATPAAKPAVKSPAVKPRPRPKPRARG